MGLVDEKHVGTACGLMTFPWLNGRLRDVTHGYTASQVMFAALGITGLVFAIVLLGADRRTGGALTRAKSTV